MYIVSTWYNLIISNRLIAAAAKRFYRKIHLSRHASLIGRWRREVWSAVCCTCPCPRFPRQKPISPSPFVVSRITPTPTNVGNTHRPNPSLQQDWLTNHEKHTNEEITGSPPQFLVCRMQVAAAAAAEAEGKVWALRVCGGTSLLGTPSPGLAFVCSSSMQQPPWRRRRPCITK